MGFDQIVGRTTFDAGDVAIMGPAGPVDATSVTPVTSSQHTFRAQIDGQDQLLVQGNTVQWHHVTGDLPGQHGGSLPTQIDGVDWWPQWPGGDDSSAYTMLSAPLGNADMTVTLEVLDGRGLVTVAQEPDEANGYTLILDFSDPDPEADSYEVRITVDQDAPDTGSTVYQIAFDEQDLPGPYTVSIGPDLANLGGDPMDQDGDGTGGERPDDMYRDEFAIVPPLSGGLHVRAVAPQGAPDTPCDTILVWFSRPVKDGTFDASDVSLVGPGGPIALQGLTKLSDDQYQLDYSGLTGWGEYALTVGPDVLDTNDDPMDQDRDWITGEGDADACHAAIFAVTSATIDAGDPSYDGQHLVVYGGTVAVDGYHAFDGIYLTAGTSVLYTGHALHSTQVLVDQGSTLILEGGACVSVGENFVVAGGSTVIAEGDAVWVQEGGAWMGRGVTLIASSWIMVHAGSSIVADGYGYFGGQDEGDPGRGQGGGVNGGGGGHGGVGGSLGGSTYGSLTAPRDLGSGGGTWDSGTPGGRGGGAIRLRASHTLMVDGEIRASGALGDSGGGGAGGSIYATAANFTGSGSLSADGGEGMEGGGGGGRVAVVYSDTMTFPVANISATGGGGGSENGADGSIYVHALTIDGPYVTATDPAGATGDPNVTTIALTLSEAVVGDGARDAATYTLLSLGADRAVGGGDDVEIAVTPAYTDGTTRIDLGLAAPLAEGRYQLTARGGETTGLRDLDGNPLDQDQDGTGDDFVTTLEVDSTTPELATVETGTALLFDGVDDFVDLGDAAAFLPTDFTLEAWIFPLADGGAEGGSIVCKEGEYELARLPGGAIEFQVGNDAAGYVTLTTSAGRAPLNQWTHVSAAYDPANEDLLLWINGSYGASRPISGTLVDQDPAHNRVIVGNRESTPQGFLGAIDDVRVWDVARWGNEVQVDYQRALTGREAGLVGYWPLNEALGTTAADLTAGGHDGTLGSDAATRPQWAGFSPFNTVSAIHVVFADDGGMDPTTVTNTANYALRSSGGDGDFANGNELTWTYIIDSVSFDAATQTASLGFIHDLTEDWYELTVHGASVLDLAGNPLAGGIDVVSSPLAPGHPAFISEVDLQAGSDSGASSTDNLTNDTTPTVDVTLWKHGQLYVDFGGDGLFDAERAVAEAGTFDLTAPSPLADGAHEVRAVLVPWIGAPHAATLTLTVDTAGPEGISLGQRPLNPRVEHRVSFSEAVDPASFTPADTQLTAPDATGLGPVVSVTGSGTDYTLGFDAVTDQGTYALTIGPEVLDLAGNPMAAAWDDTFTLDRDLAPGLWVARIAVLGGQTHPFDRLQLVFSQPLNDATFTSADVQLLDSTQTPVALIGEPTKVAEQWYELDFTGGTDLGSYTLTVGPAIDAAGGGAMAGSYTAHLIGDGLALAGGDASLDGHDVVLYGDTSTLDGAHSFGNVQALGGADVAASAPGLDVASLLVDTGSQFAMAGDSVLDVGDYLIVGGGSTLVVESANRDGQVGGEWVGVGGTIHAYDVRVEAGSQITADGQGYTMGNGPGGATTTYESSLCSFHWVYPAHGGPGYKNDAEPYGSSTEPVTLGSGGNSGAAGAWSNGGGAIRLDVAGTLTLDGEITADQDSWLPGAVPCSSWGAGGSIYVTTAALEGTGRLTAEGLEGTYEYSGGGRVAVYYEDAAGFDGFLESSAGPNGTIGFIDTSVPNDHLHVYRNFTLPEESILHYGAVTLHALQPPTDPIYGGNAVLALGGGSTLMVDGDLLLLGRSILRVRGVHTEGQVGGQWVGAGGTIQATNVFVDERSDITARGMGYAPQMGPAGFGTTGTGGQHGGGDWAYGDPFVPMALGSGGRVGCFYPFPGALSCSQATGGGAIRLEVSDTLTLDGGIIADAVGNGSTSYNCLGSAGGSVYVTTHTLTGSGTLRSLGGGPYGGGGRVAVYYHDASGFTGFEMSSAHGNDAVLSPPGPDGTIAFFDVSVPNHDMRVYERFAVGEDSPLHYRNVTLTHEALFEVGGGSTLTVDQTLTIVDNSTLVLGGKNTAAQVGGEWVGEGCTVVATDVTVDAGSAIRADGQGYALGAGPGMGASSASHGGRGDSGSGPIYGDAFAPVELGSDGGGGAIRLDVADTLSLDGEVTADGGNGGTGGSVYVSTGVLTGSGSFSADAWSTSLSGGGRVMVTYHDGGSFTGMRASTAAGGQNEQEGTCAFINLSVPNHDLTVSERFVFGEDAQPHYRAVTLLDAASLELGGGSTLTVDHELSIIEGSTIITGGKDVTGQVAGEWAGAGVAIVAEDLTLEAGSAIIADGAGYTTAMGPGGSSAGGGSHGGRGMGLSGPTYGNAYLPLDPGSAGDAGSSAGGGALRLDVADTLVLEGDILSDGVGSEGAGGAVLITARTVNGAGTVSADGSPGGGGGRIAVHAYDAITVPEANFQALATGGGQAGTVVVNVGALYRWVDTAGALLHDAETVAWAALGLDTAGMTVDLTAFQEGVATPLGEDLPAVGQLDWDTTAVDDGVYELRATFRNNGAIVYELSRHVGINNAALWHSGLVGSDETWVAASVHIVEADVTLLPGVTVTVEPGAVVKCVRGTKLVVSSTATLAAPATVDDPIVLTSVHDDETTGDTNYDFDASLPWPGDWLGIEVLAGGAYVGSEHVAILYATLSHSGTLGGSETWSGKSLHIVTGDLTVPDGATLTIEPGVVVKVAEDKWIEVQSGAELVAEGTVTAPIAITSIRDDSIGGDTNDDGDATMPFAGDWDWILIDGGRASFDHVVMRYGGSANAVVGALIRTSGAADVTLANSHLSESLYHGVLAWGGEVTVASTIVTQTDRGISAHIGSTVHVVNCTVDANRIGLLVHGGTLLDVANTLVTNSITSGIQYDFGPLLGSVTYTDVWAPDGSGSVNYVNTPDLTGQFGNLSVDPLYRDAARGHYELRYVSPAIDSADGDAAPATDYMGFARYDDPRTDNTGTPTPSGAYADRGAIEFVEVPESDVDLAVTSVVGPSEAMAGEMATLEWTVTNQGSALAVGPWHDAIYLDGPQGPVFVGEVVVGDGVTLGPSDVHNASASVRVPGATVGEHLWVVATNTWGEVFEGQNDGNNVWASDATVTLDVPELIIDAAPVYADFTTALRSYWYKFTPAAGEDMLVELDIVSGDGVTEIHVARGFMPGRHDSQWHQREWNSRDTTAVIGNTSAEDYYVHVYIADLGGASAEFALDVQTVAMFVDSVTPNVVANLGTATLTLRGTRLRSSMAYEIVDPLGVAHEASVVVLDGSTAAYATFEMDGLPTGFYDVQVRDGGDLVVLEDALQVRAGGMLPPSWGSLAVSIQTPGPLRPLMVAPVRVTYTNTGLTDMPLPMITLQTDGGDLRYNYFGSGFKPRLSMLAASVHPGVPVLPPGATTTTTLFYRAPLLPPGQTQGKDWVNIHVDSFAAPDFASHPIDWDAVSAAIRPTGVADADWDDFIAGERARYGDTFGGLWAYLSDLMREVQDAGLGPSTFIDGQWIWQAIPATAGGICRSDDLPDEAELPETPSPTPDPIAAADPPRAVPPPSDGDGIEEIYVLAIGCADYSRWSPDPKRRPDPLPATLTDVQCVKGLFMACYNVPDAHITLLTDTVGSKADDLYAADVIEAIEEAATKPDGDDLLVLWNSSHGHRRMNPATGQMEGSNTYNGDYLFSSDLDAALSQAPGRVLFVNDACNGRAMTADVAAEGRICIASCDYIQLAGDGYFTPLFVRAILADPAANIIPVFEAVQNAAIKQSISETWKEQHILWELVDSDYEHVVEWEVYKQPGFSWKDHGKGRYWTAKKYSKLQRPRIDPEVSELYLSRPNAKTPIASQIAAVQVSETYTLRGPITIVGAFDPNDKLGPAGAGPEGYVDAVEPIQYTVRFENLEAASAAAQRVIVTDALDPDLDWSTFQLDSIHFNGETLVFPKGTQNYFTTQYVDTDPNPVEVEVALDPDTGIVTWTFTSIDPTTGRLVEDPLAGFLPPNDATGSGEGYVSYTIRPKAGLAAGTEIRNTAGIVFDTNEAIVTNEALNTLDVAVPESHVLALADHTMTADFLVEWVGSDDASGIAGYDVYVSTDGGPYTLWLDGTDQASATFSGAVDTRYAFYTVASDQVGHGEAAPPVPDATTIVGAFAHPTDLIVDLRVFDGLGLNVEAPASHSLGTVGIGLNGNPAATLIAIKLGPTGDDWLHVDTRNGLTGVYTDGTQPEWRTAADWMGQRIVGLAPGTSHEFHAKAGDGLGTETALIHVGTYATNADCDVNRSGLATALDRALIRAGILRGGELGVHLPWCLDVDGDGDVDSEDLADAWNRILNPEAPAPPVPAATATAGSMTSMAADPGRQSGLAQLAAMRSWQSSVVTRTRALDRDGDGDVDRDDLLLAGDGEPAASGEQL